MAVKLERTLFTRFLLTRFGKAVLLTGALLLALGLGTFTYFYVKYARITDEKLRTGPFTNMSVLYAAPRPVMLDQPARADEIAEYLRRCQYSESNSSRAGWYKIRPDGIEVNPGPDAYDQEGAVIKIAGGRVTQIISLADHTDRTEYMLEPELLTNLFDRKREKRRIVHYDDIPKIVVDAVLSAEDKHFFQHPGVDPIGLIRAVFIDLKDRRLAQGSSTITMQLARTMLLSTERSWSRKAAELFITLHLEQKLTKKQIFEYYANSIYLGNQGSFSINGFGEASQVYFGKDLSQVTLPEAAMLAGRIQSEQWDPFLHPDKAKTRRNLVLKNMRDNGKITDREYAEAEASPLKVTRGTTQSTEAPYFVDMVKEHLLDQFQDRDFQNDSYRVYTTLDMGLQHDAEEAVRTGIVETDKQWERRDKHYGTDEFPRAQVAMVVLDTETGEVKAMVGGRDYGVSQFNHASTPPGRQPGSSFKPFVYTAALETALNPNGGPVLTPASTVIDEPTTFWFEQQPPWTPADFEDKYENRAVTLREALAHSMNVPAVKVAEMVGYDKVSQVAKRVGLNGGIKPTPSIALGAYEVTPLEIARAYTVFPNGGQLVDTSFIRAIRDRQSNTIFQSQPKRTQVIDARVAYLVENMMEEVIHTGTGASVAARGFDLAACHGQIYLCVAGKTGTSRDGWFAGFTSRLICIVWIGFDDNRDFKLEGAKSALPIWVEFMRRAHAHREYRNVQPFEAPDGIVTVDIDSDTGELATPRCPHVRSEVFIAGTQPVQVCHLHGDGKTQVAGWEPVQSPETESASVRPVATSRVADPGGSHVIHITPQLVPTPEPQKKSIWKKIGDIFK
ncbi:MAG TPA: PBP1A family penicillin-binding protein [Bryobacteraceae bacterium]